MKTKPKNQYTQTMSFICPKCIYENIMTYKYPMPITHKCKICKTKVFLQTMIESRRIYLPKVIA